MQRLFFILLLQSTLTFAQKKVSVTVYDKESEPIAFANIQILVDEDVIQYGTTDKDGKKEFNNISSQIVTVKISHLSYTSLEKQVNLEEKIAYDFILADKVQELKEVLITDYPKTFKVKEDTISYNLKSVVDGTERNLGDALKKLPGLDVDDNGIVSHNGQKIDKILIDGNDFFGSKHQMSTQNLQPEMINGVDLLKNYSDNPLESRGGKTVLNLKMKDEYRNRFIGDIALNAGVLNKYSNHNNLFKFFKQGNLGIITDLNNVGTSPITIEDYIEMRGGITNFIQPSGGNQATSLDFNQFPKFIFNNDNFKSRDNNFIGLNYTINKDKFKFIGYNLFNQSNFREQVFRNRIFLNQNDLSFNERLLDDSAVLFNATYLNFKYTLSGKSFLDVKLNLNPNRDDTIQNLSLLQNGTTTNNLSITENKNFTGGYDIFYQYIISEKLNLVSNMTQNLSDNKKEFFIDSTEDLLFLNANELLQNYRYRQLKTTINAVLTYEFRKNKCTIGIDALSDNQNLSSSIATTSVFNNVDLDNQVYGFSISSLNFLTDKTVFGFKNTIRNYHLNNQNFIRYEPSLSLGYNFSFAEKLTLSSALSNSYVDAIKLNNQPIVLDYRSISRSALVNNKDLIHSRTAAIRYLNFNQKKESKIFAEFSYAHNENNVILTNDFVNGYIENVFVYSPFEDVYELKFNVDKRFRGLPLSFKSFTYLTHSNSANFLDNNPSTLVTNTLVQKLNIFSHFQSSAFQFEIGGQFSRLSLTQRLTSSNSEITNLTVFAKVKGVIKSQVVWDLKLSNLYQQNFLGANTLFFVSPHVSYESKNKRWTYSVIGNNIFNLQNTSKLVSSLTNITFENNETAILEGYLQLGLKYNF